MWCVSRMRRDLAGLCDLSWDFNRLRLRLLWITFSAGVVSVLRLVHAKRRRKSDIYARFATIVDLGGASWDQRLDLDYTFSPSGCGPASSGSLQLFTDLGEGSLVAIDSRIQPSQLGEKRPALPAPLVFGGSLSPGVIALVLAAPADARIRSGSPKVVLERMAAIFARYGLRRPCRLAFGIVLTHAL